MEKGKRTLDWFQTQTGRAKRKGKQHQSRADHVLRADATVQASTTRHTTLPKRSGYAALAARRNEETWNSNVDAVLAQPEADIRFVAD